ncbi:MAG: hypothetical protein N2049_10155 [Anaerolineales bacterium]|nr:hypothetical protein [Anaerolineales bacterium]MCX7609565.1 hypothetical protein [Anaerolineales bacterium]MDW8226935.1 hypothetical protein [Anaerolineales bacterium]
MDFDQLVKRLEWLDEERRKDKLALAELQEQVQSLEAEIRVAHSKIKELSSSVTKNRIPPSRLSNLEQTIQQQRAETSRQIETIENAYRLALQEADKRYQTQFQNLATALEEVRKFKVDISDLKRQITIQAAENERQSKSITEWEERLHALTQPVEEVERSLHILDEAHKKETRRLADLQGELTALRKRMEETRDKEGIFEGAIRRLETRINELLASEAERRQAQLTFIEAQSRVQVERDRAWKEWEAALKSGQEQIAALEHALQEWEIAQRAVKRAQETYEDMAQKIERRINEITEMQRLAEDRFRQEWTAFKADNQKRWTSYTLTQDEIRKEISAQLATLQQTVASLEDRIQVQQDILQQTQEVNERLLQSMLAQIHEVLSAYERIASVKA